MARARKSKSKSEAKAKAKAKAKANRKGPTDIRKLRPCRWCGRDGQLVAGCWFKQQHEQNRSRPFSQAEDNRSAVQSNSSRRTRALPRSLAGRWLVDSKVVSPRRWCDELAQHTPEVSSIADVHSRRYIPETHWKTVSNFHSMRISSAGQSEEKSFDLVLGWAQCVVFFGRVFGSAQGGWESSGQPKVRVRRSVFLRIFHS